MESAYIRARRDAGFARMVGFSALIHMAAAALLMFSPGYWPSRPIGGQIYEVNLVDLPSPGPPAGQGAPVAQKEPPPLPPQEQARIIEPPPTKQRPVTLAKKVLETPKEEKPKAPARTIEDALSGIEKKVEEDRKRAREKEALSKAVAEIGAAARREGAAGSSGGGPGQGVAMRVYQVQVANLIKRNWSFPAAHLDPKTKNELEATVLVTVKSDGTIISSRFARRSPSPSFDESVQRAIDRSSPLPPFPEGYRVTVDEFEIRFNLADLDNL